MTIKIVDQPARPPQITQVDTTRTWVESIGKVSDKIKPNLVLRFATDNNYIRNDLQRLYTGIGRKRAETNAVMNTVLPGMRVPHVLNWSVTEGGDSLVSEASFEALNCLGVSKTQTTTTSVIPKRAHNTIIRASYALDSLFVLDQVTGPGGRHPNGDRNVELVEDKDGIAFREQNVKYRQFEHESFTVESVAGFPDPAIPRDDDNDIPDDPEYDHEDNAAGSYYVLLGNREVVRVTRKDGNTFYIPPGGRGVTGPILRHPAGTSVKLLGFGPYEKGQYAALGYLNLDEFSPQKSILRHGACLVSYEGYGNFNSPLKHEFRENRNYCFTGYWFVTGVEPSIGEDGVPRVNVTMQSVGYLYERQKISIDMIQRIKNQFGQWRIGQKDKTIWGAAEHNRDIPGDWVDYNSWDPSLKDSYPLQIKTEYAQHKEFFDHMTDTEMGKQCNTCRKELAAWKKSHRKGKNPVGEARAVGKHIYKQSIRVMRENGGPVKTYIRLMSTLAAAAWDHPAYGSPLAQRFTKLPSELFNNMRNIETGLVYNGQLDFATDYKRDLRNEQIDWTTPGYSDIPIESRRKELTCPFESSYDKAPFSQPMLDLAESNGNIFWINRHGYPVFVPRLYPYRPIGSGWRDLRKNEKYRDERVQWFISHGGSMTNYSSNTQTEGIFTQVWVTAETAFESSFTVAAAGTGIKQNGKRVMHSTVAGNTEGLAFTGGMQQIETVSLDNQTLGLDWNTKPANWGVQTVDQQGIKSHPKKPKYPDGSPSLGQGRNHASGINKHKKKVEKLQETINFFLKRRYINPVEHKNKWYYLIPEDGIFGPITEKALKELQSFLDSNMPADAKNELQNKGWGTNLASSGNYDRKDYKWLDKWFDVSARYMKIDIWWYVHSGKSWEEYLAAIIGIPVPVKKDTKTQKKADEKIGQSKKASNAEKDMMKPDYVIDQKALQAEVAKWQKTHVRKAINVGNRAVDKSLDEAVIRTAQCNIADPRIQPGDIIWVNMQGHLGEINKNEVRKPPFKNGIFVTNITRQMDLLGGTYTATYSGHRYRGIFNRWRRRNRDFM